MNSDPTIGYRPPSGPGRPSSTSMSELVDGAIELGLDSFTLAGVAAHVGVAESTVYGYVVSRAQLFTLGAAAVFTRLDIETDTVDGIGADGQTWSEYIDEIAQRTFDLARDYPGLREYILWGPYTDDTMAIFDELISRVRSRLPEIDDNMGWVLASRPVVLSLSHLGDPVLEPVAPRLRRAFLHGLEAQLASGEPWPETSASWRSRLVPPD